MAKGGKQRAGKASASSAGVIVAGNNTDIVDNVGINTDIDDNVDGPEIGVGEEKSSIDDNRRRRQPIFVAPGRNLSREDDLRERQTIQHRLRNQGLIFEPTEHNESRGLPEGYQELDAYTDSNFDNFEDRFQYHEWIAITNLRVRREAEDRARQSAEAEMFRLDQLEAVELARIKSAKSRAAFEAHRSQQREAEANRILLEADRLAQSQAVMATTVIDYVDDNCHVASDTVLEEEEHRHYRAQVLSRDLRQSSGPLPEANLIAPRSNDREAGREVDERDRNLVMGNLDGDYNTLLDIYDPTQVYVMPIASLQGYLENNPAERRTWKPDRESANLFAAGNSSFLRGFQGGKCSLRITDFSHRLQHKIGLHLLPILAADSISMLTACLPQFKVGVRRYRRTYRFLTKHQLYWADQVMLQQSLQCPQHHML